MLVDLVEDALSEIGYDATLAGLQYELANTTKGLELSVRGYNDKLPALLSTVVDMLKQVEIREARLKVFSDEVCGAFQLREYCY